MTRPAIEHEMTCDLLIVGAGGAGLRCAAEVLEQRPGARIIAVTKVASAQKSHTQAAQGGLAAVDPADPMDRPVFHMFDTWKGSDCMADQNVVKRVVESGWRQVVWLANRGMHFSRKEDGRLAKRTFGGHTVGFGEASAYRCVFEADRTGKGIMDTVWGEALRGQVTFIDQAVATELLIDGDTCAGAILWRQKTGDLVRVRAAATVLATGGNGQIFRVTTNCRQNTGDSLAIALRAGLAVMDPEAVQFHPTGIVGPGILASETLRSVGGILRNRDGEAFMTAYAPKMRELAPRDLVARAMETEIREGRGVTSPDHNIEHVWIDLTHLPERVHRNDIPEVTSFFKRYVKVDPQRDLCPVRPSNHYQMGGVSTDIDGVVQGPDGAPVHRLLAVGECAAASLHGFNRLGTNSLLELITMGAVAGRRALEYLDGSPPETPPHGGEATRQRFAGYLERRKGTERAGVLREQMRTLMTAKVGVFRTEEGLTQAIEELSGLAARARRVVLARRSLRMNPELAALWELDNLLAVALVTAHAARHRRESRGGHFRDDYPERRHAFNAHTLAVMPRFGEVQLSTRPVDMSLLAAGGAEAARFGLIERKY